MAHALSTRPSTGASRVSSNQSSYHGLAGVPRCSRASVAVDPATAPRQAPTKPAASRQSRSNSRRGSCRRFRNPGRDRVTAAPSVASTALAAP